MPNDNKCIPYKQPHQNRTTNNTKKWLVCIICVASYVSLCLIMGFYVYTYLWRIPV